MSDIIRNLDQTKGDGKNIPITYYQSEDTPFDITGSTVFFTLKKCKDDIDADALLQKKIPSDTISISSITRSGDLATVTTIENHNFGANQTVQIVGADQTEYNGNFVITITGLTTFTFTVSGTPATPATGTITVGSSHTNPTAGKTNIRITSLDTSSLDVGTYWYDVQLLTSQLDPKTAPKGNYTLTWEATKTNA